MSDTSHDEDPPKPVPARSLGAPGPARRKGRDAPARRQRREGAKPGPKPTPARESIEGERATAPDVEPDVEEVSLEGDGAGWTARVRGRSGGGGSPPLLLVGFWREGPDGADDGPPEREALVVSRTLRALTAAELSVALEQANPPREPDDRPPFFPEAGNSKGR